MLLYDIKLPKPTTNICTSDQYCKRSMFSKIITCSSLL